MRDNHDRMPELLTAYERDGLFFGAIAVTLDTECRQFEFGLPHNDYMALRRILQARPFDQVRHTTARVVCDAMGSHVVFTLPG